MKKSQAKIEILLDLLIGDLQDRCATDDPNNEVIRDKRLIELKRLIDLSQLNERKREKNEQVTEQSKVIEVSDEELVEELKAKRDPDLFPRRGPRRGKREAVAPPPGIAGIDSPDGLTTCAIHAGVVCVSIADGVPPVCPDCSKETPLEGFTSLKSLIP